MFALSISSFFLVSALTWIFFGCGFWDIPIDLLKDLLNYPGLGSFLFFPIGIIGYFLVIYVLINLAYGTFELFFFAGRPVKFSDDRISIGYIKKRYYEKKNITGIGIAPSVGGRLQPGAESHPMGKSMGIYIAFGNYEKSDLLDYGIREVWEMVEFRKMFPKLTEIDGKIQKILLGIDLTKIQVFDGLIWMSYTEENMRFLQNWLGSKFYEITQQDSE